MSREMYSLMRHVVGATTTVMQLRRLVRSHRHSRVAAHDGQSANSHSDASRDRSPCGTLDDQDEAPLTTSDTSDHHGDEVGPSATSNHQP